MTETSGGAALTTWRKRAEEWGRLKPPARPSPGDCREYEEALRGEIFPGRAARCLILGATPELRSLAHAWGCRVVCADSSRDMFEALRPMVSPAGPEELLCADWLELPLDRLFDVVLGDGSVNMVASGRHFQLLWNLARVTASWGAAILRVHLRTSPTFSSLREIIDWYRAEHPEKPFFPTIRTPFYMLWLAANGGDEVDLHRVYRYFGELRAAGVVTDEEFSSLVPTNLRLYLPRAEIFESMASRQFMIESVRYGADYEFPRNHPIYVLRSTTGIGETMEGERSARVS